MKLTLEQEIEIQKLKSTRQPTSRACVPALEEILYDNLDVLDHGFVRVVDYMGSDDSIVQAARVSYGTGTKKISEDRGLIRYLLRHRHTTPFEMCELKLHVKLPIFVARQWIRHRTANVNEYSARYSILDKEFYVPDLSFLEESKTRKREEQKGQKDIFALSPSEVASQSTENKQGREQVLSPEEAEDVARTIKSESARAYSTYSKLLNEPATGFQPIEGKQGLARELARMVLPVNYYTQWYWKIDLHNLLHFVALRADSHAQYEIRVYADKIAEILKRWVPLTWEAFNDYRANSAHLSSQAVEVIRRRLSGERISRSESGMNLREWKEMWAALGMPDEADKP